MDNPASSSSMAPVQRGPKACTNCRRRKIRCDGARPLCNQCRLRPPRSKAPCQYPLMESQHPHYHEQAQQSQMLETIKALRERIQELESHVPPDPAQVYLNQPYSPSRTPSIGSGNFDFGDLDLTSGRSSPLDMPEPPSNLIVNLIDVFLDRFSDSCYFFLDPMSFRASALLPLPFGHQDRPSPALLCAAYLWGALLSPMDPSQPYDPDVFLPCVLQNILHDLSSCETHCTTPTNPGLVLETIQAQVLLSFYYFHAAQPVQGRVHTAAAASLAFSASLHSISSQAQIHRQDPPLLPPPASPADEAGRINAFWAVVILNNCWVAAYGGPSTIPYGARMDTPWPASTYTVHPPSSGGGPITNFLNGDDSQGSSPMTQLAKASILLERIITFAERTVGPPDPTALASLDRRLQTFQAALPPLLPTTQGRVALLTHTLVDTAIIRLHAPHARISESARAKCLAAAFRVAACIASAAPVYTAITLDPILGPICAAAARVYMNELGTLTRSSGARSPRSPVPLSELEDRLGSLMGAMASLAAYSPLVERCFADVRAAYARMRRL